ncbi:hypothetical protein CBR_g11898 [Chara braunii]|uniref:DUF1517 domain-containing protein n=1 Tax=Chara braunii TaxID=69332 RepID=A0A388KQJ5_CHABU|nr:hypothetical protein CBR_g11898 [Chara braunii]|eukprot:GBG72319.1 hypothetical protein CBR_g11898 [Chara braunii]
MAGVASFHGLAAVCKCPVGLRSVVRPSGDDASPALRVTKGKMSVLNHCFCVLVEGEFLRRHIMMSNCQRAAASFSTLRIFRSFHGETNKESGTCPSRNFSSSHISRQPWHSRRQVFVPKAGHCSPEESSAADISASPSSKDDSSPDPGELLSVVQRESSSLGGSKCVSIESLQDHASLPASETPSGILTSSCQAQSESLGIRQWIPRVSQHVAELLLGAWSALQRPAVIAALVLFLVLQMPNVALAAKSGGRMGGRSFSSQGSGGPARVYSARPGAGRGMFSAPYSAPSPFFGGGGFGWGWSPFFYRGPTVVVGGGGGGGLFTLLLFGVVAAFLFQTVSGFLSDMSVDGSTSLLGGERISVVKLQVGLLGLARSLQRDLDRIADRADTSSPRGLHYVLQETVLALMRHPDYCVYGTSSAQTYRGVEKGEERFNQLSLEERSKFEEETMVNVDSRVRRSSLSSLGKERFSNEYIVVTILVAADGDIKVPSRLNNLDDLRAALSKLGAIPADQIQAVEILWTPQDMGDTLTERQMLRDYPQLRSL